VVRNRIRRFRISLTRSVHTVRAVRRPHIVLFRAKTAARAAFPHS
jgi:hypothetical protein